MEPTIPTTPEITINLIIKHFTNVTCIIAMCVEGIIALRYKEGGYDNFSYKIFLEQVINTVK